MTLSYNIICHHYQNTPAHLITINTMLLKLYFTAKGNSSPFKPPAKELSTSLGVCHKAPPITLSLPSVRWVNRTGKKEGSAVSRQMFQEDRESGMWKIDVSTQSFPLRSQVRDLKKNETFQDVLDTSSQLNVTWKARN